MRGNTPIHQTNNREDAWADSLFRSPITITESNSNPAEQHQQADNPTRYIQTDHAISRTMNQLGVRINRNLNEVEGWREELSIVERTRSPEKTQREAEVRRSARLKAKGGGGFKGKGKGPAEPSRRKKKAEKLNPFSCEDLGEEPIKVDQAIALFKDAGIELTPDLLHKMEQAIKADEKGSNQTKALERGKGKGIGETEDTQEEAEEGSG